MSIIRKKIDDLKAKIIGYEAAITKATFKIRLLQLACWHKWKFVGQINDYHERLWNVKYACAHCDHERIDRSRPPVCEICDRDLVRVGKEDTEAEAERVKPEHKGHWNPPLAFRCPQCQKIHILWHRGD